MAGIASPESIPQLSAASLAPILRALLEAPLKPLTSLSEQCTEAISALPPDARPTSYEGLSDVARFCVEDEPGWEEAERAQLIAGHPRIGERTDKKGAEEMSEESRKEQTVGGAADEATLQRLASLNALYEARFPGLRFVTYVAGRSRAAVADELAGLLGDALVKTGNVSAEDVYGPESEEWKAELERGLDALWDIAGDRATKIQPTGDAQTLSAATVTEGDAPEPESNAVPVEAKSTAPSAPATGDSEKAAAVGQDVPFLNLATFRMLVLSSPVLESFFESDLSSSFRLEPVTPSDPSHAWHLAPSAPGAPRAVPGSSSSPSSGRVSESASYSRDVTTGARGAIAGFLGGFLGEEGKARMTRLADEVGKRLETHTVEGPRPSFGRNLTLDGTRIDTQELRDRDVAAAAQARAGKSSLGARLAGVVRGQSSDRSPSSASSSPSPLAPGTIPPSLASAARAAPPSPGPAAPSKRASLNLSTAGAAGAAETLRAATAAIQERAHFVIDEPGGGADADADGELDLDVDVDEEGEAAGQALGLDAHGTNEDEGALRGKEAEIAKDLRTAPPQH